MHIQRLFLSSEQKLYWIFEIMSKTHPVKYLKFFIMYHKLIGRWVCIEITTAMRPTKFFQIKIFTGPDV